MTRRTMTPPDDAAGPLGRPLERAFERWPADDGETRGAGAVAAQRAALQAAFPAAVRDGVIDWDVLRQLVGDAPGSGPPGAPEAGAAPSGAADDGAERYGLHWHGKRRARALALTPSRGALRPWPDESVDWDRTGNVVVEGDNLEVLKLLRKSCAGQVKLVFIDPPYNTGRDFVYPDDYRDGLRSYLALTGQAEDGRLRTSNPETGGRFHTNWLNLMYPRLLLARTLLREDGALFVTIDDHEVAQLKLVLDELFGEENFVATIAWQKVFARKNKALVSGSHDHVLVYARDIASWSRNLLPRDEGQRQAFANPDGDPRGPWQSVSFSVTSEDAVRRKAYRYPITLPSGRAVLPPVGRHWNGLPARCEELRRDGRLWFGPAGDSPPRIKVFLSEVQQGIVPDTWWRHEDAGHNQEAKKELLEIFGDEEPFSTPKPTRLVRRILQIATTPGDDLVLDFFAGSGTTGDAVWQANAADGGRRRFVLVQLPEPTGSARYPTIAAVTRERLRRAARRIRAEHPSFEGDLGFRAFRLDTAGLRPASGGGGDPARALEEAVDPVRPDRTDADLLWEAALDLGLPPAAPVETRTVAGCAVHAVGEGALFVCLAPALTAAAAEALAGGIAAWRAALEPPGESVLLVRDAAFSDDVAKLNLAATLRQRGFHAIRSL